jgi:hypothetical protein
MYQSSFGTIQQIRFNSESDFYEFLGYLAKNDGSTKIVWEDNDEQGAWGKEGRILFYIKVPTALKAILSHTKGITRAGVESRVNCNEFVVNITQHHNFIVSGNQNQSNIRSTIPTNFHTDFDRGLSL